MVDMKKQKKRKEKNLTKKIARILINAYELKLPSMKKEDIVKELGYSKEKLDKKKFKSRKSSVGDLLTKHGEWLSKPARGYYKLDAYQYRHWQQFLRGKSTSQLCNHLSKRKNGKYYCRVTGHVMGSPKDMCTIGYRIATKDDGFKEEIFSICAGYCTKKPTDSNKSISMNRIWRDGCENISENLVPYGDIDYSLKTVAFEPEVPIKGAFI